MKKKKKKIKSYKVFIATLTDRNGFQKRIKIPEPKLDKMFNMMIKMTAKRLGIDISTKEKKDRFITALAITELFKK